MSRRAAIRLSLSTWALAATPLYAAEATLTRPDPPGTPTPVTLGVFVADVAWIDDAAQTFEVDLFVTLGWHDHRLAWTPTEGEGDARLLPLSAVWNPELLLLNRRQVSRFFPDQVRISPDGSVRSRQRLQATLTAHFDLREFPLDRQTLEIQAVSTRGPDEVALSTDPATSGHLERFSITGWSVEPGTPRIDSFEILPGSRRVVRFVLPIDAVRDLAYYLWKAMLPTALIVFMAWTVFSVDHSNLGPRIGVSTASVFTLVAFQLGLGRMLPPIPYLTRADHYLLGASLLIFATLGETVLANRMLASGRKEQAVRLDRWARVAYPLLFLLLLYVTLAP